ncbi:hypothetical protein G6F55_013012 [Rhizopus delemar]|nr:hypothetical protein G6F55_013012 [Rhizopus delemar]KAG1489120.1 hypothetical protein G6F54_011663 [Rhizopus delemar]KAG1496316.1 hypothetical protein G6F52_012952 [Rhizopus delemar]KAG1578593.1 hypothetical protein G6F48_011805 [Rhizopus delemar]KAG1579537.1 hypothetical protein G6F47_012780 [Rhizopus delemar]
MSKHILQTDEVKSASIEAVIGRKAIGHYWPRPTKGADRMKSDVLYATDNSKDMPPILVEIQYAVDNNFLHRVVRCCEEIVIEYGMSPVVLIIAIHECKSQIMNKATKNKINLFAYGENTMDPIIALGSFFIEQKQSLADHVHHHVPFIQHLYTSAKHIFQNQVTVDESMAGCPLCVAEDLQTLLNIVQRLTNGLAAARSKIEQLLATTLQLQGQLNKEHSPSSQHAMSSTMKCFKYLKYEKEELTRPNNSSKVEYFY